MNVLAVFLGGGIGSVLRYLVKIFIENRFNFAFPFSTFIVNLIGSFLIGFLFVMFESKFNFDPSHWIIRNFLLIGILGGFTTFSTFSMDVYCLFEKGFWLLAGIYILSSVIFCIAGVYCGILLGKQVF